MFKPPAAVLFVILSALAWAALARGESRPVPADSVRAPAPVSDSTPASAAHAPPRHPFEQIRRWVPRWMHDAAARRMHHVVNEFVALAGLAWYATRFRRMVGSGADARRLSTRGAAFLLQYLAVAAWVIAYGIRAFGEPKGFVDEGFTCFNSTLLLAMAVTLGARLQGWFAFGVALASSIVLALALTVPFGMGETWFTIDQCDAVVGEFAVGIAVVALVWSTPGKRLAFACGTTGVAYAMLQGHSVELKLEHPLAYFYLAGLLKISWIIVVLAMLEKLPPGGRSGTPPAPRPRVAADRPPRQPRPRRRRPR